jgi:hypothetical protein
MGIAASSAILGRHLLGLVDPRQLAFLEHHADNYPPQQLRDIRTVFSTAFNEDMHACAIAGDFGTVPACGMWTRDWPTRTNLRQKSPQETICRSEKIRDAESDDPKIL